MSETKNLFITLGASNHTEQIRQKEDYYATDPIAIDKLIDAFNLPNVIYECACGEGHLSERLKEKGYKVYSSDLIDRGYGNGGIDFLTLHKMPYEDCNCILTNPPYKIATEFVIKSLDLLKDGGYSIMLLKTTFLEGKKRYDTLFKTMPPKFVCQFINRLTCAKNGEFEKMKKGGGGAQSYAWFIWQKGYNNETIIKWI